MYEKAVAMLSILSLKDVPSIAFAAVRRLATSADVMTAVAVNAMTVARRDEAVDVMVLPLAMALVLPVPTVQPIACAYANSPHVFMFPVHAAALMLEIPRFCVTVVVATVSEPPVLR